MTAPGNGGLIIREAISAADMNEARKMYSSMGVVEIPAYYDKPLDGALYLECPL